ncbi:hypothetical protein IWQ62_003359 [Dispira parvispora]|uniref:Cyclin N-terminal domain-containing protein n=1 Tax=Dispira parvispora TaxID=1520584 RepID=A0A9W8ARY3_9FUNG|nr:hypothetical protein IWQ62_003359 [Dispira parvispora]
MAAAAPYAPLLGHGLNMGQRSPRSFNIYQNLGQPFSQNSNIPTHTTESRDPSVAYRHDWSSLTRPISPLSKTTSHALPSSIIGLKSIDPLTEDTPLTVVADLVARASLFLWYDTFFRDNSTQLYRKFVYQILKATSLSSSVVLLSLKLIHHFRQKLVSREVKNGSEFRIFTVALMLSSKFLEDNTFTTKTWAEVSGFDFQELHRIQVEFLNTVGHDLYVSGEGYFEWLRHLLGLVRRESAHFRSQRYVSHIITNFIREGGQDVFEESSDSKESGAGFSLRKRNHTVMSSPSPNLLHHHLHRNMSAEQPIGMLTPNPSPYMNNASPVEGSGHYTTAFRPPPAKRRCVINSTSRGNTLVPSGLTFTATSHANSSSSAQLVPSLPIPFELPTYKTGVTPIPATVSPYTPPQEHVPCTSTIPTSTRYVDVGAGRSKASLGLGNPAHLQLSSTMLLPSAPSSTGGYYSNGSGLGSTSSSPMFFSSSTQSHDYSITKTTGSVGQALVVSSVSTSHGLPALQFPVGRSCVTESSATHPVLSQHDSVVYSAQQQHQQMSLFPNQHMVHHSHHPNSHTISSQLPSFTVHQSLPASHFPLICNSQQRLFL